MGLAGRPATCLGVLGFLLGLVVAVEAEVEVEVGAGTGGGGSLRRPGKPGSGGGGNSSRRMNAMPLSSRSVGACGWAAMYRWMFRMRLAS
jgi:hypothetical protein